MNQYKFNTFSIVVVLILSLKDAAKRNCCFFKAVLKSTQSRTVYGIIDNGSVNSCLIQTGNKKCNSVTYSCLLMNGIVSYPNNNNNTLYQNIYFLCMFDPLHDGLTSLWISFSSYYSLISFSSLLGLSADCSQESTSNTRRRIQV